MYRSTYGLQVIASWGLSHKVELFRHSSDGETMVCLRVENVGGIDLGSNTFESVGTSSFGETMHSTTPEGNLPTSMRYMFMDNDVAAVDDSSDRQTAIALAAFLTVAVPVADWTAEPEQVERIRLATIKALVTRIKRNKPELAKLIIEQTDTTFLFD